MGRYSFSDLLYAIELEDVSTVKGYEDKLNNLIYHSLEEAVAKLGKYEVDWAQWGEGLAAPFIYADDLDEMEYEVDSGTFDDFLHTVNKIVSRYLYKECGEKALKGTIIEHKRWFDSDYGEICDDQISGEEELIDNPEELQ